MDFSMYSERDRKLFLAGIQSVQDFLDCRKALFETIDPIDDKAKHALAARLSEVDIIERELLRLKRPV